MHRSSESIGTIAGALAKAQAELTNPEKSLTAIIRSPFPRESDRTFRYASLSSGLDIVRKALGKHEIATVQTTAIDEAGLIRLTTVLAHSSGKWVSSDWPVCPASETAAPHRMGAALRPALCPVHSGWDRGRGDLDAPDLISAAPKAGTDQSPAPDGRSPNGHAFVAGLPASARAPRRSPPARPAKPVLEADQSLVLRDRLVAEIDALQSADEATGWAHRSLPAKNRLTAAHAEVVESGFRAKLAAFGGGQPGDGLQEAVQSLPGAQPVPLSIEAQAPSVVAPAVRAHVDVAAGQDTDHPRKGSPAPDSPDSGVGGGIDKSVLAIGEPRRVRDKEHRKFVSTQACLICGRQPSDPHHLRFAQPRALGRKVSDEFTVPLCRIHHREVHRGANEAAWWDSSVSTLTSSPRPYGRKRVRFARLPSSRASQRHRQ
jgi:hypothetical protein